MTTVLGDEVAVAAAAIDVAVAAAVVAGAADDKITHALRLCLF